MAESTAADDRVLKRPALLWVLALAAVPFALKFLSHYGLGANYVAQSLYKLGQLFVPVLWRRRVEGRRGWACWWYVEEPLPTRRVGSIAVALAVVMVALPALAIPLLAQKFNVDPLAVRAHLSAKFSLTPALAVPAVVFLSTLNAGLEEFHFRGWLDRQLSMRCGALVGALGSAAAFALMHLFIFAGVPDAKPAAQVGVFVVLFGAGLIWSWLARRPGGIHAAWLAHGLTDAGLLTWGLFWIELLP